MSEALKEAQGVNTSSHSSLESLGSTVKIQRDIPKEPASPAFNMESLGCNRSKLSLDQEATCMAVKGLNLHYGSKQALFDNSMNIPQKRVTAFIGPSGCGKSTLLRSMNRMNDLVDGCRVEGELLLDERNIYEKSVNVDDLRHRVGVAFQKLNPFPKSIYENAAYGLRIQGINKKRVLTKWWSGLCEGRSPLE